MKTKTYTPQPIDTTGVELPEELEQLVEQMSKNVHEVWSETRIRQECLERLENKLEAE